jgi:hypothetical protein
VDRYARSQRRANERARRAIKTKGAERRRRLLARARSPYGIWVNCEGGMSIDDPDLKKLRKEGKVRLVRLQFGSMLSPNIHRHKLVAVGEAPEPDTNEDRCSCEDERALRYKARKARLKELTCG